jgi:hypothetical protein
MASLLTGWIFFRHQFKRIMKILADFEPLNSAETKLLEAYTYGHHGIISETRPTELIEDSVGISSNKVRAPFIQWLVLDGAVALSLHEHGVQLVGAWIVGFLDLSNAELINNLELFLCNIAEAPILRGTILSGNLNLQGSMLQKGLIANKAQISGDVILSTFNNTRFESRGLLRFDGAAINGNLELLGSKIQVENNQDVLNATGAHITGYVFFRSFETFQFESLGSIRLSGSTIGGDLDCSGAALNALISEDALSVDSATIAGSIFLRSYTNFRFKSIGEVRLTGVNVGRNLECDGAELIAHTGRYSLSLDAATIGGGVFLRNGFKSSGEIRLVGAIIKIGLLIGNLDKPLIKLNLNHCKVGFLQTDENSWGKKIELDGFIYDSLLYHNWKSVDYLNWLSKQREDDFGMKEKAHHFKPQPWQQLISVLRKMGHNDEARDIAIAFEKRRYEIGKVNGWWKRRLHWVFGILAGYGYKPLNLVGWMLAIWLSFAACFWWAAYQGVFTPSDPLVFQNAAYDTCRSVDAQGKNRDINNAEPDGKTNNWYTCGRLMGEYTTFSPLTYSLDVILPLVDLGQEKTWGTYIDTAKPDAINEFFAITPNHIIRLMVWLEILFGWMASLMLVAVLTGLTDRNKQ